MDGQKLGLWAAVCLWAVVAAGCGQDISQSPAARANSGTGLPTASIGGAEAGPDDKGEPDADDGQLEFTMPKEGTPEWLVHEATRLLLESPPETDDIEALKKHRRERNEKIIRLAKEAIQATHTDPEKERLFTAAVHNLLEARLQLALAGDSEQVDLLYEDAEALFKRAPESAAAAEGAHTLVSLTYTNAKSASSGDTRWLKELARQARHFAESFPNEERRSLPMLFTAARSCELSGLAEEALECYELIPRTFPKSTFAARVTPIVRRLKLVGNRAQLAGPSLEGESLALDDYLGHIVLVVFWSTDKGQFVEQLPDLLKVARSYEERGLRVLGINLDQESTAVQEFLIQRKLPWPQIFFPEPEKRGWNNPAAAYYGVMDVPALWLVDQSGFVVSTNVNATELELEIEKVLEKQVAEPGNDSK